MNEKHVGVTQKSEWLDNTVSSNGRIDVHRGEIASMKTLTRRALLRSGVTGLAALGFPSIVPASVLGADGAVAPSNRITLGQVGFGWIGGSHLDTLLNRKDVRYVAACDVNGQKLAEVRQKIAGKYAEDPAKAGNPDCAGYGDFREMLAHEDLDAVVIATPDHWHALISICAAQAGKDIYCEKPLTLTIREAARSSMRSDVTIACSKPAASSVPTCSARSDGAPSSSATGGSERCVRSTSRRAIRRSPCDLPAEPQPADFDWDMWLGPTPWRPYHSKLASINWRPYREYCGGGFADMGAHHFDIAQWALDMDHSGPVKVYPPDGDERPRVSFEYANGVVMNHVGGNCLGLTFHGTEGTLYVGSDGLWTKPESIAEEPMGPNEVRLYESNDHHGNWLDCIR